MINCLAYSIIFLAYDFFSTEIIYFEYYSLCLCEERRRYFSKIAEGFSPIFLRKVIVKIHQHLRTAWKIIDNYRLHYAFKQASKILNQTFKTTEVQGKNF